MKKLIVIMLSLVLLIAAMPMAAFADSQSVTIRSSYNTTVNRSGSNYLTVISKSSTKDGYRLELVPGDDHLSVKSGTSGIITSTDEVSTIYEIGCDASASIGAHKITVNAYSTEVDSNGQPITSTAAENATATEAENAEAAASAVQGKLLQQYEISIMVVESTQMSTYGPAQAATSVSYTLSGGDYIYADGINTITVTFMNRSNQALRNAELTISFDGGITIYSGASNVFVGNVGINQTATATYPIVCPSTIKDGSYKVTATLTGGVYSYDSYGDASYSKVPLEQIFYVPVINGSVEDETETTDVAKPILMVSNYSCGGSIVAGKNFGLSLTLLNTSKVKLQNIKVTLNPSTGMVPVGSSNSFYIESIAAGESVSKALTLASDRSMTQGYYGITVDMSYEDTNKASYSSSDTISVPVVQESRLVVDDILDPGWLTMTDQGYASVTYRNMGNNSINNLQILVEGDFTMESGSSYFVGTLASGKQDYYNFNFWPNQAGPMAGRVTFVYEDADGTEHSLYKEFNFNIGEGYTEPDPGIWEEPVEEGFTMPIWGWAAIAVAAIVILVIVLKAVKKHKAKKQEALELDE